MLNICSQQRMPKQMMLKRSYLPIQLMMSLISLISILYIFHIPYTSSAYVVVPLPTNYKYQPQQLHQPRNDVYVSSKINPTIRIGIITTKQSRIQNDISLKSSNVYDMDFVTSSLPSISSSSSISLSAVTTLDPTTFLSDIFSNVLGTPLILAIPIVAALLVASLIAFFIVSYANPAEEDD